MDAANIAIWSAMAAVEENEHNPARRRRRQKGEYDMNNELLERLVGIECVLALGTTGGNLKGTILSVRDNWVELQTKKETCLINTDYVSSVKAAK